MKATVYSNSIMIGTTYLSILEDDMVVLSGSFHPNEAYFSKIQKYVWNFWSEGKTDWEKWYSLNLNVQLENGYFLYAHCGLSFDDMEELVDEPINIEMVGIDRHVVNDYFKPLIPKVFVEKPWKSISIKEKLSLEKELEIELGLRQNKFFRILTSIYRYKHPLIGFKVSALARDQRNDDVLFRVEKTDSEEQFAVVHLTWKGEKEIKGYPQVSFYKTFYDFHANRMKIDQEDWS